MTRNRNIDRILKNMPRNRTPREFAAFIAIRPDVTLNYTSPSNLEFLPSAAKELVPFIETGDGSVIALWFAIDPAPVVLVDAHGEPPNVLAIDFLNFLRAAAAGALVPDMDDYCPELRGLKVPGVSGKPVRRGLAALRKKLLKWAKTHSALREPDTSPAAESLRKRIAALCRLMIEDGLCKVYRDPSKYWAIDFRIARRRTGLETKYLTYGEWHAVPPKYEFDGMLDELLALANKRKPRYELTVTSDGIVSLDGDKTLVLVP